MASMDQFGGNSSDDIRRKMAMALLMQGMDTSPVKAWTQGAARLASALAGNIQLSRLEDERSQALSQIAPLLAGIGRQSPGSATPSAQPPSSTVIPPTMPVADGGGSVPTPPPRPVFDRRAYTDEANDPAMSERLASIVAGEVGSGASPEQQRVQAETIFNRATARGQPLSQVTQQYTGPGSAGYYPASTFVPRTPEQVDAFRQNVLAPVLRGSDTSGATLGFPATGNASGGVAARGIANGRYSQYGQLGPETYVQQPGGSEDIAQLEASRLPPGATPAQYAGNRPAPVQAPQPAPQGQDIRAQIAAMLESKNPTTQEFGAKLGMTLLQQQLQPAELKTLKDMTGQDVPYWARPSDQTLTPATVPGQAGPMATSGDVSQDYESRYPGVNARVEQLYRGEGAMPNKRTNPLDAPALMLIQQKHPDWNMTLWKAKNAQQVDFAKGKAAANIKSLNTVIGHMGDLKEDYDALGNVSGVPLANQTVNDIKNWYAGRSGEGPIKRFDLSRNAVSDELARVFRETGTMSDSEVHQWKGTIDSSHSVPQQKAVIGRGLNLLESRLNAINDQWTRLHPGESFPILSDSSRQKLNKLREWANGGDDSPSSAPSSDGWGIKRIN